MSQRLTMRELKESIDQLKTDVQILRGDFQALRGDFSRLEGKFDGLGNGFSQLQGSVDQYLKRTEAWHDEHVILKARHDRLSEALVEKKIVTKEETLL